MRPVGRVLPREACELPQQYAHDASLMRVIPGNSTLTPNCRISTEIEPVPAGAVCWGDRPRSQRRKIVECAAIRARDCHSSLGRVPIVLSSPSVQLQIRSCCQRSAIVGNREITSCQSHANR